jgi:hypothetical protein
MRTIWSSFFDKVRLCGATARLWFGKEPVGILALVVSVLGLYTQINAASIQSAFINAQGEMIKVEFDRDRMFKSQQIVVDSSETLVSKWDVTISNTSIQTPTTITHFAVFKKFGTSYSKMMGDDSSSWDYTIFSSRDTDKPVRLPFTIAAGATMNLTMSLDLQITKEAAQRLRELSKIRGMDDLSLAERHYSYQTNEHGSARDIFGTAGYDDGGFSLVIHKQDTKKIDFPIFRLDFITNRGKVYSAYSSWYYMMYLFPDPTPGTSHHDDPNPPDQIKSPKSDGAAEGAQAPR